MPADKSPSRSVRCFVAMAFDHNDTDSIFQQMKRTLGEIGVSVRRVDRIEHNDDIDDRIILEIKQADFVIADLTYARPSVYFEAGYAQGRPVPVVYTARKDHFQSRSDDSHGNFRVHFDLQMRNIIAWARPGDAMFAKHLKTRVHKVISPILKQKLMDAEAKHREASFKDLALKDQLDLLRRTARRHFEGLGFEITTVDHNQPSDASIWTLDDWAREYFSGAILGIKRDGGNLRMVFFHPVKSVNKQLCQQYRYKLVGMQGSRDLYEKGKWEPQKVVFDIFVCALSGSNVLRRLSMEIPHLRAGTAAHSLVSESRLLIDRLPSAKHPHRQFQVTVHVVDSIRRLSNLEQELEVCIPK
jgi:nucleoside 2-deoxyribosyltransferase